MKAIFKEISGQKILVASCDGSQVADDSEVVTGDFEFESFPEATPEIRQYIDEHSMVSLHLYAVDTDLELVRLRTPAELDAVPYAGLWPYRVKPAE